MKRAFRFPVVVVAAAPVFLLSAVGCDPCADDGNTAICGDFGELAFAVAPDESLGRVRWPAVATSRETVLFSTDTALAEMNNKGDIQVVQSFDSSFDEWGMPTTSSSAPSLADDGTAYVVRAGGDVRALADDGSPARWARTVNGSAPGAPPALGTGVVHVTVASEDLATRDVISLDVDTGDVVTTRPGSAAPVVTEDDGLVYMDDAQDCGATYGAVVAEDATGAERFRHVEPSGVRDFAPGLGGELYVVNGDRELVRLDGEGNEEWRFTPDCFECTVAGAPTVTDDAIYFPVWQGEAPNNGCGDNDPDSAEPMPEEAVDPLYALKKDGSVMWTYDGFSTLAQRHQDGAGAFGVLGLAMTARVQHHPAGRPVVADDGTLFVPTDGAIVMLDKDGRELGFAMFDPSRGEQRSGDGGLLTQGTTNTGGFAPGPTLADDGQLTVWDGAQLRGFRTGKKPATIPWSAPFGGNRNAGRIGR